jgi:hypothetical protein
LLTAYLWAELEFGAQSFAPKLKYPWRLVLRTIAAKRKGRQGWFYYFWKFCNYYKFFLADLAREFYR